MAIKFDKVKAGDRLWDYHSERAGNTTMRRWGNWEVLIVRIEERHGMRGAVVRWNVVNPEEWWPARRVAKLRRERGPERGLW
jgi:hypothetical protein